MSLADRSRLAVDMTGWLYCLCAVLYVCVAGCPHPVSCVRCWVVVLLVCGAVRMCRWLTAPG